MMLEAVEMRLAVPPGLGLEVLEERRQRVAVVSITVLRLDCLCWRATSLAHERPGARIFLWLRITSRAPPAGQGLSRNFSS
jgi:hypothetical protein